MLQQYLWSNLWWWSWPAHQQCSQFKHQQLQQFRHFLRVSTQSVRWHFPGRHWEFHSQRIRGVCISEIKKNCLWRWWTSPSVVCFSVSFYHDTIDSSYSSMATSQQKWSQTPLVDVYIYLEQFFVCLFCSVPRKRTVITILVTRTE